MVAERGERGAAAVVSPRAAERYGLEVLAAGIEDTPDDRTRFLVVAPPGGWTPAGGAAGDRRAATPMRTTLVLGLANEPGSLVRALRVLAEGGLNMSKLESRPLPRARLAVRLLDRPRRRRRGAGGRRDAGAPPRGRLVPAGPGQLPAGRVRLIGRASRQGSSSEPDMIGTVRPVRRTLRGWPSE